MTDTRIHTDDTKRNATRLYQWRLWAIYTASLNSDTREAMHELSDRELRLILSTLLQREAA